MVELNTVIKSRNFGRSPRRTEQPTLMVALSVAW